MKRFTDALCCRGSNRKYQRKKKYSLKVDLKHFRNIMNTSTPLAPERLKMRYEHTFSKGVI
jgi:hypothetical protein